MPTSLESDCEVHYKAPTQFMYKNWQRLLPDYLATPEIVIIILLKSQFSLNGEGEMIIKEKDRLLKQFLALSNLYVGRGTEIISPVDGTPQFSRKGELAFDLVAVVHELLGWPFSQTPQGCKVLKHPLWGEAVYPGIVLK